MGVKASVTARWTYDRPNEKEALKRLMIDPLIPPAGLQLHQRSSVHTGGNQQQHNLISRHHQFELCADDAKHFFLVNLIIKIDY